MKKTICLVAVLAVSYLTFGQAVPRDQVKPVTERAWKDIVALAKEEGTVVWYNWYLQPALRTFTQRFTERYGISVVMPDGTADGNFTKFMADQKKKVGDMDVLSFSGDATNRMKMSEAFLGPLKKLPGFEKLKFEIQGGDSQRYAVAFWGNQTGFAYNPARIKEADLPQTIEALSAWMKANPRRFGFNAENGGTGPAFIESVARNLVPGLDYQNGAATPEKIAGLAPAWAWFQAQKANFVVTASNVDSLTRLNDGEFSLVSAFEDHLAGLQKSKTLDPTIRFYIPAFGMPGGGNMVGAAANAPHKAAALLFVQWLTSAEVQDQLNFVFGSAPENSDAKAVASLVKPGERVRSRPWAAKPFGDRIKSGFIENVLLK